MKREEFWEVVEKGVNALPEEFAKVLDNVEIMVRNYPDKETHEKIEKDGLLMGLYVGIPITRRGAGYGSGFYGFAPPDRIYLYQKNIERYCLVTGDLMVDQIKDTLFHEIGHYMGLDEDEVSSLKFRLMK